MHIDIQWYEWLYYINTEDCSIYSYPKLKRNGKVFYTLKGRRLKKTKKKHSWLFYISLFKEWGPQRKFHYSRLVACLLHKDASKYWRTLIEKYMWAPNVHYRDWNINNHHIDNLYFTWHK